MDWVWVVTGLLLLAAGGEALVRGASGIALLARITPAVVGLTVVSAGTSTPELVVSVQSAVRSAPALAAGNIVGSNLFNIGVVLGLTAIVLPVRIQGNAVRLEWPVMMLATFQFHLLVRDGYLDRLEGSFLLTALVAFLVYVVRLARRDTTPKERQDFSSVVTASFGRSGVTATLFNVGAVLLGVALLAGGSTALVTGAVGIATGLGVSETTIGLTVVAAGTSAPELVTSMVSVWRGRDDVAVATAIGSNTFNLLGIGGATAVVHPLPVDPEIISRDNLWMLAMSLAMLPLMKSGLRINRFEGAALFVAFCVYMTLLVRIA